MTKLVFIICSTAVAGLALIACGGATSPIVVARVGQNSLTKSDLERWTKIEAVLSYQTDPLAKKRVPKGVIPDPPAYTNCIDFLRAHSDSGQSSSTISATQLKRECSEEHHRLQFHILDILLTYYWLHGEAAEKGIKLTEREIQEIQNNIFPNPEAFRRYQAITGMRTADERLIIEKDLLDSKLLEFVKNHRDEQVFIKAATDFTSKWAARTWCHSDYVVSECKQYKAQRSLVAP